MRTHAYSIAVAHRQDGDWTVTIVQSTYDKGQLKDARIVWGPLWLRDDELDTRIPAAVQQLKKLVKQDEDRKLSR